MQKVVFGAALVLAAASITGCASMMADDLAAQSAFTPSITADGTQSFRFVTKNSLPSYYQGADVREVHEQWIANELGHRQYCPDGYEIGDVSESGDMLIYEGVCR